MGKQLFQLVGFSWHTTELNAICRAFEHSDELSVSVKHILAYCLHLYIRRISWFATKLEASS